MDFNQLAHVYEESNRRIGRESYPYHSTDQQLLRAEQDQFLYLSKVLSDRDAFLVVWAPDGVYKAAARLENYKDGYLLAGVETAPEARRQGYAKTLITQILHKWDNTRIYAHIDLRNNASIRLHEGCGFEKHLDHAIYLDGSVSTKAGTYIYQNK